MPTRILREGILSSPRIDALSTGAELFYRRLMTVADDYGRFYASPVTLRGACWPLSPEKVTERQVTQWLSECISGDKPLLSVYSVAGCRYLQIHDFGQQTRGKSKFPEMPACLANDNHLLSNCLASDKQMYSLVGDVVEDEDECAPEPEPAAPNIDPFSDWFEMFWSKWVKAANDSKSAALKVARRVVKSEETRNAIARGANLQREERKSREPKYRPHLSTWLNQGRWNDTPNLDLASEPENAKPFVPPCDPYQPMWLPPEETV